MYFFKKTPRLIDVEPGPVRYNWEMSRVRPRAAFALFACTTVFGQDQNLTTLSRSFERLVESVTPSVVQVIARGVTTERSSGSGVIVDSAGYIVTNAHVVGAALAVQVLLPLPADARASSKSVIKPAGKLVPATVVGADAETDLAVLKIGETGLRALRFGNSEALRQGQLVFAFGSPFGLENTVTMGVVSSAARQVRPDGAMIYVQTDASINPGNSGGPLVDATGAVVGINTFIVSNSGSNAGLGFAAPSNIVNSVYEQIRKNGRVRRGQVGIQAQTITPELARSLRLSRDWGVIVGDVAPKGSAEAAGIEIGDILLTMNGKVLENARQFGVNVYAHAGETVTIELLRGSEKLTKTVAVLERPPDPQQMISAVAGEAKQLTKLGALAVSLDEKVTPLLPALRRLSGVVIALVVNEAPGQSDPLLPGDVIYAVNGAKIASVPELESALANTKRGDTAALQIERQGQIQFAVVEIQ
jgi:serine protease Do